MNDQLWQRAERAPAVAALYAQAEKEREKHPERFRIDAEEMAAKALRKSGRQDFDSPGFMDRLKCLVDSINQESRMNALGIRSAGKEMPADMVRGSAELARMKETHPHIFRRKIVRPVFIIGGSRTGTTLLQRLLAADPANRSPLLWEMSAATIIGKGSKPEIDAAMRKAEMGQQLFRFINPTMQSVHFSDAHEPEECVMLMGTDLRNWALQSCMNVPAYCKALSKEDFTESYVRHREMLQMITDESDPRQWVLKAPYHLPEIESLIRAYPDALIINTHRDPVDTVTSTSSLYAVFRSTFSDDVNPAEVGAQQVEILSDWFRRVIDARSRLRANSQAKFFDVRYSELVADPLGMVRRIYEAFGLDFSDRSRAAMQAHLDANKRGKHGSHRYTPEQFGLKEGELRERFAFYSSHFGLS